MESNCINCIYERHLANQGVAWCTKDKPMQNIHGCDSFEEKPKGTITTNDDNLKELFIRWMKTN